MSTIWKTVLRPDDVQTVEVPEGAEILCAREQNGEICIWYRCAPGLAKETRRIAICGTGHPAPTAERARYLGTAFLHGGSLVFHVFEETPTRVKP